MFTIRRTYNRDHCNNDGVTVAFVLCSCCYFGSETGLHVVVCVTVRLFAQPCINFIVFECRQLL